jgi:uncharacterized protein (DUF2147 family)
LDTSQLKRLIAIGLIGAAFAVSAAAARANDLEGHWENPKHTTVVNVSVCGPGPEYCAVVLKASAKAQANAAKGGTTHFIGTEILRVKPAGDGVFKGTAFDPESNMHVDATVRLVAPGVMDMKGCALLGLVCESQRWTKVSRD